jgi:hypothetical protein
MPMKRYGLLIALLLLTLSLKGCVYLRLLEVKLHLSEFEKYFRLEDAAGLDLVFLKPVLLKDDILFLARKGPTFVRESKGLSTWQYYFEKKGGGEDLSGEAFDVPVDLFFEGETLTRVTFPRRFIQVLPRPFLVESFRAIGTGEVKKGERHVSGTFPRKKEGDETPIPGKTDFLNLLGRPTEERRSSPAFAMNYTFLLKPAKPDPGQNPPHAWASFEFHAKTHLLRRLEARFAGIRLSMTIDNAHPYPTTP